VQQEGGEADDGATPEGAAAGEEPVSANETGETP